MSKKEIYFQQQLGLDEKNSNTIKILMHECLLEPLLNEMRDALEAEDYQSTTKEVVNNCTPHVKKRNEKVTPMEALLMMDGLSLEEAREWASEI